MGKQEQQQKASSIDQCMTEENQEEIIEKAAQHHLNHCFFIREVISFHGSIAKMLFY